MLKITSEIIMHCLGLIIIHIMHFFCLNRFSNLRISLTPLLAARCSSLQCESTWCHHRWRFGWRSSSRLATGVPWTSKSNKLTRYALPKNPWTLQRKGEWTCISQGCISWSSKWRHVWGENRILRVQVKDLYKNWSPGIVINPY